jgi:type VI secretion system protein ImpC
MPVTRIAHYLKALARDKVGSFMSRDECHRFLNDWITRYVTEDDLASAEVKAKKPLREARIDVEEIPGRPGAYRAVAYLRPHFQLDRLDVMLSLVAELPEPRGS